MSAIREAAMTMWRIDTHAHLQKDYGGFEGQAENVKAEGKNTPQNHFRVDAYGARALYGIDPGPFIREDTQQAEAADQREQAKPPPGPELLARPFINVR